MVTAVCLCEVSALWCVYVMSGVYMCEVCALCIMRVMSGVCLCEMHAQWSVSVHVFGKWCLC